MYNIASHSSDSRRPALPRLTSWLADWQARARSRRLLASLDERTLRDLGLDRAAAEYEANLPFWRRH